MNYKRGFYLHGLVGHGNMEGLGEFILGDSPIHGTPANAQNIPLGAALPR